MPFYIHSQMNKAIQHSRKMQKTTLEINNNIIIII